MIANFFRILTDYQVEYLLISGQASVLYGAATFSEDIDLWINPHAENSVRFIAALRACGAQYYKLTPPFAEEYLRRGHGFHFLLPASDEPTIFLDVLGQPPRMGDFPVAVNRAQWMDGAWGRLHVIGLKDLVAIKKTQRLEDYPIISRLALAWLNRPEGAPTPADWQWALDNIFTANELREYFAADPAAARVSDCADVVREFGQQLRTTGDITDELVDRTANWMQQRMARLQQADRVYWRPIIAELRTLRQAGQLMTEGQFV